MAFVFDGYVLALWAAAYLVGAIPFGWIVARSRGIDIRAQGSGNIGATNIGRVMGRKWGLLVFLLDAGKCFAVMRATWLVAQRLGYDRRGDAAAWLLLGSGIMAIVGNIAPIYLGFRGGKAVSAATGVMLGSGLEPALAGLICMAVWFIVVKLSGYVSLGSIVAALLHPIAMTGILIQQHTLATRYPLLLLSVAIVSLIIIRHRANIGRLRAGSEKPVHWAKPDRGDDAIT